MSKLNIIIDRTTICDKVKSTRKEKQLCQKQVAAYLGVTQSNYSQMENGVISINVEQIAKLAVLFEKEVNDFFIDNSTPPTKLLIMRKLCDRFMTKSPDSVAPCKYLTYIISWKLRISK
jgi:transcriptional regulator with XRE-family HTH domain